MTPYAKMLITALADFVIAAGGTVSGAMIQQGSTVWPTPAVWLLAAVTGAVLAFSHIRASMAEPPVGRA